jgi:hypothetical protein
MRITEEEEDGEQQQQPFWQFSDQLRVHISNLANLSLIK